MPAKTGVILGQNYVRLSDTALDDLFLSNFFCQKQCKYEMNIEIAQVRGALYSFYMEKL